MHLILVKTSPRGAAQCSDGRGDNCVSPSICLQFCSAQFPSLLWRLASRHGSHTSYIYVLRTWGIAPTSPVVIMLHTYTGRSRNFWTAPKELEIYIYWIQTDLSCFKHLNLSALCEIPLANQRERICHYPPKVMSGWALIKYQSRSAGLQCCSECGAIPPACSLQWSVCWSWDTWPQVEQRWGRGGIMWTCRH